MDAVALKIELVKRGIRQGEVAELLGIDQDLISKRLLGSRPMPEGFADEFLAALDEIARRKAAEIEADARSRIARLLGEQPSTEAEACAR